MSPKSAGAKAHIRIILDYLVKTGYQFEYVNILSDNASDYKSRYVFFDSASQQEKYKTILIYKIASHGKSEVDSANSFVKQTLRLNTNNSSTQSLPSILNLLQTKELGIARNSNSVMKRRVS